MVSEKFLQQVKSEIKILYRKTTHRGLIQLSKQSVHFPFFWWQGHQAQKSHCLAGPNAQKTAAANRSNESIFQGPTKARIYSAIPAPGISLYCQPVPVDFCSPLPDKFFYIPLLCTDMFIQQLIKPPIGFSKYFQWIKFDCGKRIVGMNLLSLSAGSRGSCRSKNISPFVCRTCPRIKGLPKSRPTCKTQITWPK